MADQRWLNSVPERLLQVAAKRYGWDGFDVDKNERYGATADSVVDSALTNGGTR